MVLYKLEDVDPDYQSTLGNDIKGHDVYSDIDDDKVGSVKDILVDEEGYFRYLVVDTGFWVFGKKVLLPVGRSRIDEINRRVYAVGLTKEQVENLPEFSEDLKVDYDYEEQVRGVYRTQPLEASAPVEASPRAEVSAPLEASAPLDAPAAPAPYAEPRTAAFTEPLDVPATPAPAPVYNQARTDYGRDTYTYQQEPSLYDMNEQDHQTLRLYEERLVANKKRRKTGEVEIGKHVETETARVSVPVEKERVIIERVTPADAGRPVSPGQATFREGEVAHVEIYEETADIRKEAVVREEVRIRKEVERDTVEAQETIRREELDIDTEGRINTDRRS